MPPLFLVSCVSKKRPTPAAARDLYTSELFRRCRAYVEARRGRWYILSAEHGLVEPACVLAPYERTLNAMGVGERRAWAKRVIEELVARLAPSEPIVFLAGERYREFLVEPLRARCHPVEVPMHGMRIGEQLHWLGEHMQVSR